MPMSKTTTGTKAFAALFAMAMALADASAISGGWSPKFYEGREANGRASEIEDGYKGASPCIELRWLNGAQTFGVAKRVAEKLPDSASECTITAEVRCDKDGAACAAMEFFDGKGRSLGVKEGETVRPKDWLACKWKFAVPATAVSAYVHMLSLSTGAVRLANVKAAFESGRKDDVLQLSAYPLPVKWNRDWNGGKAEFTTFADAPLPMAFHFKGLREKLKRPAFEIDIPEDLELIDAFTEHMATYRGEVPVKRTPVMHDGVACVRLRFEDVRVFYILQPAYGWERKLALLVALKKGAPRRDHVVRWRVLDANHDGEWSEFTMKFVDLPKALRTPKSFDVAPWQCDDRLFSRDAALAASIPAYEAAGMTWFWRMNGKSFPRGKEIERALEARSARWRFVVGFPDLWFVKFLGAESPEFKALDVARVEFDDGVKDGSGRVCPEYFNEDPAFRRYLRDRVVVSKLKSAGVKTGDFVTMDLEPWGSQHFCVCARCRAAFARNAGLAQTPSVADLKKHPDEWAEFRCAQTEKAIAIISQFVREYDPGLVLCDYDYVLDYGSKNEKSFFKGCGKDTARNEKWFDLHVCSYYHVCDLKSFQSIRNNTRHLKKPYVPIAAVDGAKTYLRDGEVRHPRQLRMLALAAFVHGCPGISIYKGLHFDGEHLLAFMKARDEIASVEDFDWGGTEGRFSAVSGNAQCVFATATAKDGAGEAVAVFNYDKNEPATARIAAGLAGRFTAVNPVDGSEISSDVDGTAGISVAVPPEDVRFVVLKRK